MESIFMGIVSGQLLILSKLLNTGRLDQLSTKVSPELLLQLKATLVAPPYTFLFVGLERLVILAVQIALSLLVVYALKTRNIVYIVLPFLIHALLAFIASLLQAKLITLPAAEIWYALFALVSLGFIITSRHFFKMKPIESE